MSSPVLAHPANGSFDKAWVGIFILIPILIGSLLMLVPVHMVLLLLLIAAVATWLAMNPATCFYLVLFTLPFTERIRVLPISFSLNDLMILFCGTIAATHILLKKQKVDFRTKLDPWIWGLTAVFFLAGFFSEIGTARGMLEFFKYFEAIVVYYLTVYFLRTHQVTRAGALKVLLTTAVLQAVLGIAQSFTGSLGADFQSSRGYLGYLGLGSSMVWHGRGTFDHFNGLGGFLAVIFVMYLPLYYAVIKRKAWGKAVGAILLMGLLTTYSRGSILGIAAGSLFFLSEIQTDRRRSAWVTGGAVLLALPVIWYFANSAYVNTLSFYERLMIWQVPIAAITETAKDFWLGSGLNSYEVAAWPYIPANVPVTEYHFWFAHNGYLLTVLEMGILGALVFFGFLVRQWYVAWRQGRSGFGFRRAYGLAVSIMLVTLFAMNLFDHSLGAPYFKILYFFLLGLLYVKPSGSNEEPLAAV